MTVRNTPLHGEQLRDRPVKREALPLDRFRTEFMGHNIGVPADWLFYKIKDYEAALALALLPDVPVRSERDRNFRQIADIDRIRETFGYDESHFHSYWEADMPYPRSGGHSGKLLRHPARGILVAVANLAAEKRTARVTIDHAKLGLQAHRIHPAAMRAEKTVALKGNSLDLPMNAQSWTLTKIAEQ